MAKKVSLAVVAKEAGVSKAAASVVLNKKENEGIYVSDETKKNILAVAKKYEYVVPKSARELVTGRSDNIGLVFHSFNPFFAHFVEVIQKAAFEKNLEITPYITDGNPELEEHYLEESRDGRVDGVLALGLTEGSAERYRRFTDPPFNTRIVVYGPVIEGVATVHFDEEMCGRLAYQHLKASGCEKFAAFGLSDFSPRIRAFCECAARDGNSTLLFTSGKEEVGGFEEGLKLAERFFAEVKPLPEGVFCFNDLLAVGLLQTLRRHGVKMPEEVKIVGCDNTEIGMYTNPMLTSVDTNVSMSAEKSIGMLRALIRGKSLDEDHVKVPVTIAERESTRSGSDH